MTDIDDIPECVMEIINKDKRVQKINRFMEVHGFSKGKQRQLDIIQKECIHTYYDTMNGISKTEQKRMRSERNIQNRFFSDFSDITRVPEQPKPPEL